MARSGFVGKWSYDGGATRLHEYSSLKESCLRKEGHPFPPLSSAESKYECRYEFLPIAGSVLSTVMCQVSEVHVSRVEITDSLVWALVVPGSSRILCELGRSKLNGVGFGMPRSDFSMKGDRDWMTWNMATTIDSHSFLEKVEHEQSHILAFRQIEHSFLNAC